MERDEAVPSRKPRIERYEPDELFAYAADKERWIQRHLASGQQLDALVNLARELEATVAERYETPPLVIAKSQQVYYPVSEQRGGQMYVAATRRLPLAGDAELFGAHEIEGQLYGFAVHPKREEEELVAYLRRAEPMVRTRTGIHVPLWSVPVQDSEIYLAETIRQDVEGDLIRRIGGWVLSLSDPEAQQSANKILSSFVGSVRNRHLSSTDLLDEVENCVSWLRHVGYDEVMLEQIFDLAALRLGLHKGVTMTVRSHRIVHPAETVRGYTPGGPREFKGVVPQFAVMGESLRPFVGLMFYEGAAVIEVDVRNIERLSPTMPDSGDTTFKL